MADPKETPKDDAAKVPAVATPTAPAAAPAADGPTQTYDIESWAGLANYGCKLCPFASLDEEITQKHINDKHGVGAIGPAERPDFAVQGGKEESAV